MIAEKIEKPFEKRLIRHIASDEVSSNEVAKILGGAIGKPGLTWTVISDEQRLKTLLSMGMNPSIAKGLMEMDASRRGGKLYEDYYSNRPAVLGKIKMKDFAKEFETVYYNSNNINH